MGQVFELYVPSGVKLTLLALSDCARDDGSGAYPSVATLARKTSLSVRSIQTILRKLERAHFIASQGRCLGGRGKTVEYKVTLERGVLEMLKSRPGKNPAAVASFSNQNPATERVETPQYVPENPAATAPESKTESKDEPAAARVLDAKHIEEPEKAVQQFLLTELATKKQNHRPPWVRGELAEDLYQGIHSKQIASVFFDSRLLEPRERIAACVGVAVTTLVTSRVARLKVLSANEIERRAIEELLGGLATLELVRNFEARRRQTVQAVTRVVIEVCVQMLKKANGG
jgi:Helix-turn-helix domain